MECRKLQKLFDCETCNCTPSASSVFKANRMSQLLPITCPTFPLITQNEEFQ